jgi:tetratricopeptide (TPR) repeat protein
VLGATDQFNDAIEFILQSHGAAPGPLVELAKMIANPRKEESVDAPPPTDKETIDRHIHAIRTRLRDEPRNAIQWVELSRLYTLNGESTRALRSMAVATALGGDNRFVVRSAARLFLHEHDSVRALRTIRTASGAKTDPWLLAAEIAVASASESPSLLAQVGRRRNEDSALSQFERTELSSALATLELENGKNRHARQLFRRSLMAPNENSVAQVEWANRQIGGLQLEGSLFRVPRSYEANAQVSLASGEWNSAIGYGFDWLLDQSFSKTPAIFTSYVSSLVEEYGKAIKILRTSLKVNPDDSILINNLAFALASDNRVDEAAEILRGTDYTKVTGTSAVTLAATHGLVCFRTGFPDRGRELYQLAMERARASGTEKYRLMADLYLAREELLASTSVAGVAAKRALANASKSTEPEVAVVAAQVRRLYEKVASSHSSSTHLTG